MVRIRSERFPPGAVKKLHTRAARPFKVIKRINNNAYILNLPEGFGISLIFNIENLVAYKGPNFNLSNPLLDEPTQDLTSVGPFLPPLSYIPPYAAEQIDKIIENKIISTTDGGTRRYLVHWKGNLNLTTLGWIERMCSAWILMLESSTRAAEIFTRRGRVFPNPGELMRISEHVHVTDVTFNADDTPTC